MNSPIRVLHVLQRMEAGGTQALLMNIYRNIDRTKVQFDFLVEYPEKQFYDDEIISLGGKIYRSSIRTDFNLIKFKLFLKHFFKKHSEYTIVHVHTYSIGYFVLKEAKKYGIKVRIAHSHSNEAVHDYKYIPKLIMQKLYTRDATDLLACSDEAGKYLYGNKKFGIVKNSIDSYKFISNTDKRKKIRNELSLNNKFVVGNVGRLRPEKNQKFLLEVFSEIKKIKSNAILIIVGTGPMKKELDEEIQSLGISKSVLFLGNRRDMDFIYQAMDVFVFPSLYEGFGISAIESQASGIPTVCSEGVPNEVNVSPLFRRLSLNDSSKTWAYQILNFENLSRSHINMQKYILKSGYDIKQTAIELQSYYLNSIIS